MKIQQQRPAFQRGMSFWSLLVVLAVFGFFILVAMRCIPMYLNQMKVAQVMRAVAQQVKSDGMDIDMADLRRSLEKRWDIEDISWLDYRDVKVVRNNNRRTLSYDYEARQPLFYNVFVVIHFKDDVPIANSVGD